MNALDIGPLRLAAHGLAGEQFSTPEDAVKHMLAMQSQDYTGGLWSVAARTKGATQSDVEQAIADHKIVRTWPMRGTLHFLHADDVWWMLDLLAGRATAAAKSRRINQLGLTDEIVAEAEAVLRAELRGGKSILRGDVVKLLSSKVKGITIDNQHTQHLMRNFGERGVICFGPHQGKQPTFVLLDEWVPRKEVKPRDEALAELARRYFVSHGPATLKDFAGWGMMTMGDAKAGLAAALDFLESADIDGAVHYFAPGLIPAKPTDALLLAGFDEYLLGYKNRDAVLIKEHSLKVVPGNNGMFLATVVYNGQVVGLWKRIVKKSSVDFTYDYFPGLKPVPTETAEARYSSYVFNEH